MNVVTHALLPVVAVCAYQRLKSKFTEAAIQSIVFTNWQVFFIGVLGAAPDLLNPHLSIQSRYDSWSHSIAAWLGITILLFAFSFRHTNRKRMPVKLVIWMSAAYLIHLGCDIIAGGIVWLKPISNDVLGDYYVSAKYWIPLDIFFVLSTYVLFRKEFVLLVKKLVPANRK